MVTPAAAETPTATLIVTRTVTHTATRTVTTLAVEDIHHTTVTGTVTLTGETVATGERDVARLRQEAAGVGIVPLRAPGADAATVGAHLGAAAAVRQNHPVHLTTVLLRLLRRTSTEGGEPLKRQKIFKGEPGVFLQPILCADNLKVTGKKKRRPGL